METAAGVQLRRKGATNVSKWDEDQNVVAHVFFSYIRRHSKPAVNDGWVRSIEAWRAAVEACSDLDWVRYFTEKGRGQAAFTSVLRALMKRKFTEIEFRHPKGKRDTHYRVRVERLR